MRTVPRADTESTLAFVSVVERGGFREAARGLGVPRSTLSQRVQRLEAQLGVQLFARGARALVLTPLGERYYEQVLPALRGLWQAEASITESVERPSGRVRITAPFELGQTLMPTVLAEFAERYPDVELIVELTDRVVNIIEEGFDIAIRIGALADSALTVRRLGQKLAMGIFASPVYLKTHGCPTTPEDLRQHRCMTMGGQRDPNTWRFSVAGKSKHLQVGSCINVNSFSVLMELAAAGLGLARLPVYQAVSAVQQGRLVEVLAEFLARPVPCHAVFQGGRNQPKAVRALLDILTKQYGGK
jgi:DNA-binding transcriptional LysR family regulator